MAWQAKPGCQTWTLRASGLDLTLGLCAVASVVGMALGAALELCIRLPLSKRYSWAQYADKLGHMHEEPSNPIAGEKTSCLGK